jgi:membrane protein DedA with SNARE-associated domain
VPDFELIRDLLIFFGVFAGAGFGVPIPEELAIVAAGLWTAGKADQYPLYRWLMLPVCIVGVLTADVVLYAIGRYFGTRLLDQKWFVRMVPREKRQRIESNFDRYGVNILLFGRLIPGIRSPLFLTAGTMRLSVPRFLLADGLGAVAGNSLLFFLAFWFGDQFKEFVTRVEDGSGPLRLTILVAIVLVGFFFLIQFLRRPVPTGDPEDLPIIGHQVATHIESSGVHKQETAAAEPHPDSQPMSREPLEKNALRPGSP